MAYKRPPNIRDNLIRAKIPRPNPNKPKRNLLGMKQCLNCGVCPYVRVGKSVRSTNNNYQIEINTSVNCSSINVIYMVGCKKCTQQYIGETERSVRERFREHMGYVTASLKNKATGQHFNEPGHKVSDMTITVIEKVFNKDPRYRKQREKMFINKFNTRYKGLNKMSGG